MTILTKVDLEKEKYALIRRHIQDRRAHFDKDIATLLNDMAAEQIYVRDGQINTRTRPDTEERFTAYFDHVAEFIHWDDTHPPVIRISPDGAMAWMASQIRLHYRSVEGEETDLTCAWLAVYEKQDGDWIAVANASTFTPSEAA